MARSVRSRWVITKSTSSGKLLIALLVTLIFVSPASCTFLRRTPAPMALEPIVACDAGMGSGTHGAGTHTGVAGYDDFTYGRQVARYASSRNFTAFRLGFHILHTTGCIVQIVAFFHFAGFQQEC